jgi:hypothetical protein
MMFRLQVLDGPRFVTFMESNVLSAVAAARAELTPAQRASARVLKVLPGHGIAFSKRPPHTVVRIREVGIVMKGVPW